MNASQRVISKITSNTAFVAVLLLFSMGCTTIPDPPDYGPFMEANPHSVLVVPVLNNSPEVTAADYFLATISVPLAERGYYVFPVNMSRELLADAGLSDPGLVHGAHATEIASLFGADSVLYVTITNWEAKYLVFATTVTVGFEYVLKDGRTGETLWSSSQTMNYTPQNQSSGNAIADLIVMAIQAAATKALPNYIPLARQANWKTIANVNTGPGQAQTFTYPILMGPYHKLYKSDWVVETPDTRD
jgi:hypothetical protein